MSRPMLRSTEQKDTVTIESSQHRLTQIGIDTVSRSAALHVRLIQLQLLLLQVHPFARKPAYVTPEERTRVAVGRAPKSRPSFLNTFPARIAHLPSTPR